MKILIGMPCGETIKTDTVFDLVRGMAALRADGHTLGFATEEGTLVDENQNRLAQAALDAGVDALWLIDSDMTYDPRVGVALARHLTYGGHDVVGCTYPKRKFPHNLVGKHLDGRKFERYEVGEQQVDYLGTGMLMIRTALFRTFPRPWFKCIAGAESSDYVGNDMFFCRAVGAPIICDFDYSRDVGHTGQITHRMDA
jgi:hypothetical protein